MKSFPFHPSEPKVHHNLAKYLFDKSSPNDINQVFVGERSSWVSIYNNKVATSVLLRPHSFD